MNRKLQKLCAVRRFKSVIGLKMYAGKSTGDLAVVLRSEQEMIYAFLAKLGHKGVLAVHCEKEELMNQKQTFNSSWPFSHCLARPEEAEIESIKDQIEMVLETGFKGKLHICHVSCPLSVDLVNQARSKIKITCGITPHHLMFYEDKLKQPDGVIWKTNPPLRSLKSVMDLRLQVKKGFVDWVETDHAPHAIGEKLFGDCPSGFPSLYLYRKFVEVFLPDLGLNQTLIDAMTGENIIRTYNLEI